MVVSLLYLLFRRVLAVAALRLRSREFKELEIVVLRHELAVLRRQVARPRLDERDRVFLAAASQLLSRAGRPSFFIRWQSGDMCLRWTAAGMLEAERQFRRVLGYRDLAKLALAVEHELNHHDRQEVLLTHA